MSKYQAMVLAALLLLSVPASVRAADGDKLPEKPKASENADRGEAKPIERPAEKPTERIAVTEKSECDDCEHGHVFTRFWTHTVGGSIGHGLKKGGHKISSAF